MTDAARIAEVLEPSHVIPIILYVHDHPGCMRSDVYRDVTRNANTLWKMRMLESHASERFWTTGERASTS